ncbi:MAG: EAL domain-containing protein [Nevskiales bacterium]
MNPATSSFELTARLFKTRANRYAVVGTGIALLTVIVASLLACAVARQGISLEGLLAVQKTNPALWLLDLTPFVFALWGQYTGSMMAYQASALVLDETASLRQKASALEYQIEHGQPEGPRLGLPNRRALRSALTQILARPADAARWPAVLMIEIDQLRDVDRIMGDEIAEDLMRIVAQRLQNIIGREQVLAYLGHSEFGLLTIGATDADELQRQALRIHRALDTPVAMAGMQISLHARIGAAIASDGSVPDAENLLRRAEIAKYAARTEQNDFQIYDASLETRRAGRLSLTAELHSSIGNEGLELAFAQQLKLSSDCAGSQRLRLYPRWPHPHRGMLEENDFLDLPERGGLLHGLSLWLLQQGLDQLEQWRRKHDPALVMVVRLPEKALVRLPLSEMLTRLLAAHDLPGDALVLECSETSMRDGGRNALRHIESLTRQGVGICLAGLGGPYCGLATLLDFPISEVSLSASLTQRATHEQKARQMLGSHLALAHEMKLVCSAVDVNSDAQLELLRSLACDWVEGPVVQSMRNASASTDWLQRRAAGLSSP